MRFLAVDDEPDTLLLVRANVRAWGHECATARTCEEALVRLRSSDASARPDVLLLDVAMPDTDGPTLLESLRASGDLPPVVLLVSAVAPEELHELATELGVDSLSKPFTAERFREKMAEVTQGAVP